MDYLVTLAPSIIAALTILLAYLQNRDNNRSKRSELAFQKRLDAFAEIFKAFNDAHYTLDYLRDLLIEQESREEKELRWVIEEAGMRIGLIDKEFIKVYGVNRVYIPAYIDKEILQYQNFLSKITQMTFYQRRSTNHVENVLLEHDKRAEKILAMMHKFIGFK